MKSVINNTCNSSICYDLFRASQKLCRASKNHAKLVLKLMLVPTLAKNLAKNNDNDILDFVKIHR